MRGATLCVWHLPAGKPPRRLVLLGAHTDSPCLRVKPRPERISAGVTQLGVEVYGSPILASWFDRDLGIAGRVMLADRAGPVLVQSRDPICRVPHLAIHLDRSIDQEGFRPDRQRDLPAVWSIGDADTPSLREWVAEQVRCEPDAVTSWDLVLFDFEPGRRLGRDRSIVSAARIDNLASCHAIVEVMGALAAQGSAEAGVGVMAILFDHEEVGSTTYTGAAGATPRELVHRVLEARGTNAEERRALLARSHFVSVDGAHATHPNRPERHDPQHPIRLGGGPVVKWNANARYATDAESAAFFIHACKRAGIPCQEFVMRSDLPCGTTIGPLVAASLGVRTVDVGLPQLSMHSIREMCAAEDVELLRRALLACTDAHD